MSLTGPDGGRPHRGAGGRRPRHPAATCRRTPRLPPVRPGRAAGQPARTRGAVQHGAGPWHRHSAWPRARPGTTTRHPDPPATPADFGAGEGVDLVFAMAVPSHYTHEHLALLAELAERFGDAQFRDALRQAADPSALLELADPSSDPGPRCMNTSISARELFDQQRERLGLRWIAGKQGEYRELEAGDTVARRPSLAGYLNAIYPNKVQILGSEELTWLDSARPAAALGNHREDHPVQPLALVISKNQPCPEDLRAAADESGTPLWGSPKRGHELLNHLSYHLARTLAPRVTLHGVFMEIYSIGVLITGEAGSEQERAGAGTAQPRPPAGGRRRAGVHPDRPGRARRHLSGIAAGPARSAWPGRAQRARRCSATPR